MQDGIQGDRKHIKVYSTLRSEKLSNFVFGLLECWEVSFNAIEEPRSGEPCASCMWFERKRQVFDGVLPMSSMSSFYGHCLIGCML